jgi:diguanylate cyclase
MDANAARTREALDSLLECPEAQATQPRWTHPAPWPGVNGHGLALGPQRQPGAAGAVAGVAIGDWNHLLGAVMARLRSSVGDRADAAGDAPLHHPAAIVRCDVLECVAALDQLHATLRQELDRRQQLELEVVDAQAALAQARAELVGTRAGERRARHLAEHDVLTSLPNRKRFRDRLDRALAPERRRHRALAVFYLDLDAFKPINDLHGHAVGDEVLRIVAMRLTRALREGDMVSRQGGDEFVCLIEDGSEREPLARLACKLLDAVACVLTVGELRLTVAPSIGIAMCPRHDSTSEELLRNADTAMYRAKRSRCGYAFSDDELLPDRTSTLNGVGVSCPSG